MKKFYNRFLTILNTVVVAFSIMFMTGVSGVWLYDRLNPPASVGTCILAFSPGLQPEFTCFREYKNEDVPDLISPFEFDMPDVPHDAPGYQEKQAPGRSA